MGRAGGESAADFAFFCHDPADLDKLDGRFILTPDEILLLNPNTGTCPVFRTRRDAEISLGIYRRLPILLRDGDPQGNPWGLSFMQGLFNMTSDSHLFHTREQLEGEGWTLDGNTFTRGQPRMLPLYEAKMLHHYDHRWATYDGFETRGVAVVEKSDSNFAVLPRYWVAEEEVNDKLAGRWDKQWLLGWRDICRSTDERTMIDAVFPRAAAPDGTLLMLPTREPACLVGALSSFVFDYAARQKVGGTHLKFFTTYQLPCPDPLSFQAPTPWCPNSQLRKWINERVVELTYSAADMSPWANDFDVRGLPFEWVGSRRVLLRAELDAAYFHLYGIDRDDVDYILDTFPIARRKDEAAFGEYRTKRLILEIYGAMADAMATGSSYQTLLDPPPGHGSRHKER